MAEDRAAENAQATPEVAPEPQDEAAAPEPQDEAAGNLWVRDSVPAEIRDVSFPMAIRGYDRAAVEAYVERVNRVIAELEVGRSPQAAIRHALDRVGEQTVSILREARDSAEKVTATAREDADNAIDEAKAQAADLVVNASAQAEEQKVEGRQALAEGQQALADSQAEAGRIVAEARAEANGIVADARGEAERRQQEAKDEIAAVQTKAETRLHDLEAEAHAVAAERESLLEEVRTIGNRLHEVANTGATRDAVQNEMTPELGPATPADADADADAGDTIVVEPRK